MNYKIKKGDTLIKIAKLFNLDYRDLGKINNLKDFNKIYAGDTLTIPERKIHVNSEPPRLIAKPLVTKTQLKPFKPKVIEPFYKDEIKRTKLPRLIAKPKDETKRTLKKSERKPLLKNNRFQDKLSELATDLKGIFIEGNFSILDRLRMLKNGYDRKIRTYDSDTTSKERNTKMISDNSKIDTTVISPLQSTSSYNISNDTTFFDNRRFAVPRSLNLSGLKFGSRNRGDRTTFESREVIPMYRQIIPFENHNFTFRDNEGNINEFMGYDKNGNLKLGTLDKFAPGDMLTQVFYGWITNVPRDNQGNPLKTNSYKDSRRYAPQVDMRSESGKSFRGALQLMTPTKLWINSHGGNMGWNQFNNVVGGHYILLADNEIRLVRGSINNVLDEIEKMLKNHKGKAVKFYEVDNGSYNRGMLTKDGIMKSEDQAVYDSQNSYAGHYFYVKPDNFPIK